MKKILLPIIGSLIIGSTITGGTVYAVKTIRHNAEVERIRTLFQNEAKNAEQLIGLVNGHLESIKNQNGIINTELDRINTQSNSILTNTKEVYKKAISLASYKVKDHETKDVTYYLAYYNSQSNEIKATEKETTELDSDDKKEIPIPATLENLLNAGIKVQIESSQEDKVIKTEDFNKKKLLEQNSIIVKVLEKVLKEIRDGGQKLADFFQNKLNELTKLKKDLETLNEDKFFDVLKKIESSLVKDN
ncbi:hypothetical protein JIY74_29475 [Vibrio harveyi]|nr:hypothetical protein [Vibrio harveyi]